MKKAASRIPVLLVAAGLSLSLFGCGSLLDGPTASPSPSAVTASTQTPSKVPAAPSISSVSSPSPSPSPIPTPSFQSQLKKIQSDAALTDNDKIGQVVQLFFDARAANFKDDGAGVDLSAFLSGSNSFDRSKIINFANLTREARKTAGLKVTSDKLTLMIYSITLNGNAATVSMGEVYTYQLDGIKDPSAQRFGYNVYMTKEGGSWLVSKLETDNEAFTNDLGDDTYHVDKALQDGLVSIKAAAAKNSPLPKTPAKSDGGSSAKTSLHPINRTDAAAYALKYALDYNSAQFISWSAYGGDCIDFASQCVWYGLGGRETSASTYKAPMVSLWNMASDGEPHTGSFISMSAFYSMLNTDYPDATPHLSGDCYPQGGVANAAPGDIIQLYDGSDWFHTYAVSSVSGTAGARTPSDIQVSAHNSDIQNVNFYTQWAAGHPNAYRLIHIDGVYY